MEYLYYCSNTHKKKNIYVVKINTSTDLKFHHVQSICDHVEPSVVVTCLS